MPYEDYYSDLDDLVQTASNETFVHWPALVTADDVIGSVATSSQPLLRNQHHVADASFDKTIRVVCLAVIVASGTIGCLLVCTWLWRHRRRTSHVNALIWHLTVSDLLVITCACVPQLVWEFDRRWTLGVAACKALKFTQSFVIMASNYMLVVLALDRHQAIRSPLREPSPAWKQTLPGWLVAAVLSIPQVFIFRLNQAPATSPVFANMTVCESIFRTSPTWVRQAYLTYVGVVVFYIPLALIAVAYIRIFLKIASRASENKSKSTSSTSGTTTCTTPRKSILVGTNSSSNSLQQQHGSVKRFTATCAESRSRTNSENDNGGRGGRGGSNKWTRSWSHSHRHQQQQQPTSSPSASPPPPPSSHCHVSIRSTSVKSFARARSKTFKMTVVIVGAFVAFGLPYHALEMIYSYGDHRIVPAWLAALLGSMAVANSAVNPFVFLAFSVNIRSCFTLLHGGGRARDLIKGGGGFSTTAASSRDRGRSFGGSSRRQSPAAVTHYSYVQSETEDAPFPPQYHVTMTTSRNNRSSRETDATRPISDDVAANSQEMELTSLMQSYQQDCSDSDIAIV